jgi:hypothetical protein
VPVPVKFKAAIAPLGQTVTSAGTVTVGALGSVKMAVLEALVQPFIVAVILA